MAVYLLDTSTISFLVRRNPAATARAASLAAADSLVSSMIVRGELLFGLERMVPGPRRTVLEREVRNLLGAVPCCPVTEAVSDRYAQIKSTCQRKGTPLDENDLWIAATALSLGATLVAHDPDFGRIEGLAVEDWTR